MKAKKKPTAPKTKAKKARGRPPSRGRIFLDLAEIHTLVDANGKPWRFEFHSYAGPMLVDDEDTILDPALPPDDSPFWTVFNVWEAGRRAGGGR